MSSIDASFAAEGPCLLGTAVTEEVNCSIVLLLFCCGALLGRGYRFGGK